MYLCLCSLFFLSKEGTDYHSKGSYRQGGNLFVVKVAGNSKFGNNGEILAFDVESCELKVILQDKGFLTPLRTAIVGIIVVDLVPWEPKNIGIIGSSSNPAKQLYELARAKYSKANIMLYAHNKARFNCGFFWHWRSRRGYSRICIV